MADFQDLRKNGRTKQNRYTILIEPEYKVGLLKTIENATGYNPNRNRKSCSSTLGIDLKMICLRCGHCC